MGWAALGRPGPPSGTSMTPEEYMAAVAAAAEQRARDQRTIAQHGHGSMGAQIAAAHAARQKPDCPWCKGGSHVSGCTCTEPCDTPRGCAAYIPPDRPGDVHLAVPVPRFRRLDNPEGGRHE